MNFKIDVKKKPSWLVIALREISSFFFSPVAYIVMALFLAITGFLFFSTFFLYNQASMRSFFSLLPILFAFFVPAMTMRLFADEKRTGTMEVLLTLPVTGRDVVLGKFAGSVVSIAILLLPTLAYPITIAFVGDLDPGVIAGGYIGSLFLGSAFAAIGIFASIQTDNQIIAFVTGFVICAALVFINSFLVLLPAGLVKLFAYISAGAHFENISRGVLDSRDFIYFISLCALFLLRTILVVDDRRNA